MRLLDKLELPVDLSKLSIKDLERLATEIRQEIINTVARTGGHLAPSLGVVELTLALHTSFKSPVDKIIWDVGHQSYGHKILTGRLPAFHSLRQRGGISGFPKRTESPHDPFDTGHSSTSISAALGMALARDLKGEKYHVIAVIGDGALTGGMALEALNHAGHLKTNLMVVLNDNEMSISPNVGALSGYLSRLRTDPRYSRGKEEIENILRKLPAIGPRMVRIAEKIKDTVKYLVVPGMIFEELGFTYLGPIDGHNLQIMCSVFNYAKTTSGPVLIHVITQKGKGYSHAEKSPDTFHGVGPFDPATGRIHKSPTPLSYTEVFGETIVNLAGMDNRIVTITAAMSSGTGLNAFAAKFPKRFFDVGIAEQHAVTLAAGMAATGLRPVVVIYSTFLQRAYDQITHDVCMQNLPVVFCLDRAGLVGEDGETHHGVFDLAYLRSLPGMNIMAPKDENELQHMLFTACSQPLPVAIRYPRGAGEGVKMDAQPSRLPWGKGEVLREGKNLVILAVGPLVYKGLEAAELLAATRGVDVAVINMRFVKPLDNDLILRYARRAKGLLTVEDGTITGGMGSAVLELLARARVTHLRVVNMGVPDRFIAHGKISELKKELGLSTQGIFDNLIGLAEVDSPPKSEKVRWKR